MRSTLTTVAITEIQFPFISKDSLHSLVLKTSALLGTTEKWLTGSDISHQLLVMPRQVHTSEVTVQGFVLLLIPLAFRFGCRILCACLCQLPLWPTESLSGQTQA